MPSKHGREGKQGLGFRFLLLRRRKMKKIGHAPHLEQTPWQVVLVTDFPSIFSKTDFYGILLPGYLVLVASILLFRPDVLLNAPSSFDLLSTVVFVVAGPVLGLTIQQSQRIVFGNLWAWSKAKKTGKKNEYRKFMKDYHHARLESSESERLELDINEALYDFNVSSLVGLTALSLAYFSVRGFASVLQVLILLFADILFLAGAYFSRNDYGYVVRELIEKHPLPTT